MVQKSGGNVVIENAQILFRNFEGKAREFNSAGDRNFCVIIPEDAVEELTNDGWNIKELKVREEGDIPQKYAKVNLNYEKGRPPRCVLIRSNGKVELGADEVDILDWISIKKIDMVLNPWQYEINGNKGTSLYLRSIFVTVDEDPLELKYNDVPKSGDDIPDKSEDVEEAA